MQITVFKALKSIDIDDAQATNVVNELEKHMATLVGDAVKGLEAQNRVLESKVDAQNKIVENKLDGVSRAMDHNFEITKWMIGIVILMIGSSIGLAVFLIDKAR